MLTSPTWLNACGVLPSWRPRVRVPLLAEQPDVVAQVEQPLEELARLVAASGQGEGVGEPEAAREERALVAGQPVDGPDSPCGSASVR